MHPSEEDGPDTTDVHPIPRKIDPGLYDAYRAWQAAGEPDASIAVVLTFHGSISAVEAGGFRTGEAFDGFAVGVVRFADIPAVTAQDGVVRLSAGRPRRPQLDRSARDVKARGSGLSGTRPTDGVWFPDATAGTVRALPDGTGQGVIVAIIDTGIDYGHPMFYRQVSPTTKESRILRIWDQGATPASVSDCPAAALTSGNRYGAEHTHTEINTALNGGAPLGHRDCDGHGTHVAGIAAGGVPGPGDTTYVGIAPEADILVVKHLDLPTHVYSWTSAGQGAEVSYDVMQTDALLYCLRVAQAEHKPVVINISSGTEGEAGDGLDDNARFADQLLAPTAPAHPHGYPQGAILVHAAGNSGEGRLGRVVVPASGRIEVPFTLIDDRSGEQNLWNACQTAPYAPGLTVGFWYRSPATGSVVRIQVCPPHGTYTGWVAGGASLTRAVRRDLGPPVVDNWVTPAANVHGIEIVNYQYNPFPRPGGTDVYRDYACVTVSPKQSGGAWYLTGIFHVKIDAPAGTVLYFHSDVRHWNGDAAVRFVLSSRLADGSPAPAGIEPLGDETIVDGGGRHVLTVGAYSVAGYTRGSHTVAAHGIEYYSARGPMRDYSDPPLGPLAAKPDIAAPGHDIRSAGTRFGSSLIPVDWLGGRAYATMSGTSMAAPVVAGAVALLLDKHPTWNIDQVRAALAHHPRTAADPAVPAARRVNAFGVGLLDVLDAHRSTP